MIVASFRDWLVEQEHRKSPAVFLLEWLSIFVVTLLFWTIVFFQMRVSVASMSLAAAVASVYASGFVYIRLLKLTACKKCSSPLLFSRQEIGSRYVREVEKCLELEHGGEEWYEHFIDIYTRKYRVEVVKYRCRRCRATWEEVIELPASDYRWVRTIKLKD